MKKVTILCVLRKIKLSLIKSLCDQLNSEQNLFVFNILQFDDEEIKSNSSMEIVDFYQDIVLPIKDEIEDKTDYLLTLTDIKTYAKETENSVSTHFSRSEGIGIINIKNESAIEMLRYRIMRTMVQIHIKKYLLHTNCGCFFDKKTSTSNNEICDFCTEQLLKNNVTQLEVKTLQKFLKHYSKTDISDEGGQMFVVIIMDIVKYSQYTDRQQKIMIKQLQKDIHECLTESSYTDDAVFLPTGDGCIIALTGRTYIKAISICMNIQKTVRDNGLDVRYGINVGNVFRYRDINQNINIAGSGVNMAARAMDIGDGNHIIANRPIYDALENIDAWHKSVFHELGDVEVKHGIKLKVYNVYSEEDDFGNPALPEKLKKLKR